MNAWSWATFGIWCSLFFFALLYLWYPGTSVTLWERGRWALIFEPCDFWVGVFYSRETRRVYMILIPTLPVRYSRT